MREGGIHGSPKQRDIWVRALVAYQPHCHLKKSSIVVPIRMNLKPCFYTLMAALLLFGGGCAGWSGPNGLGQLVLVVCKTTPEQLTAGQDLSNRYFSQVASGKRARPARRYVAVQTLDPNQKQRTRYAQTRADVEKKAKSNGESLSADWVDDSHLHCIMIFDVVTHEAVGTNCYVVGTLPTVGTTTTYDTFPAEFVAGSAQFVAQ